MSYEFRYKIKPENFKELFNKFLKTFDVETYRDRGVLIGEYKKENTLLRAWFNPQIEEDGEVYIYARIVAKTEDKKLVEKVKEVFGKPVSERIMQPSIFDFSKEVLKYRDKEFDEIMDEVCKKFKLPPHEFNRYLRMINVSSKMHGTPKEVKEAADLLFKKMKGVKDENP
ncbi:MAG: hypothetical protein ACTSR0_02625 [Candidatus Asgardarchaeia archaeon]